VAHHLFALGIPYTEKVLRTIAVYVVVALLLRLAGKRDVAQLNTFDLVVMLLLSNVVQNAVIGEDNSLLGGAVGAAVLVGLNSLVVRLAATNARVQRVFEGSETVLVEGGRYVEPALRREALRKGDVDIVLRRQGANDVGEVARATLAAGGSVLVALKPEKQPATKGDIASLAAAIERIEQRLSA
jgi:uncharacterized membrane protein YcaP (DUF421 family)